MVVAPVLPPLVALVVCLFALAFILCAHTIIKALFYTASIGATIAVGWVPWLGGKVKRSLHFIEQRVNNYMSGLVSGTASAVAASWHALAVAAEFAGKALVDVAQAAWRVAWYVNVKFPVSVISALAHYSAREAKALLKRIEQATIWRQTVTRVINNPAAGRIGGAIKGALKTVEGELANLRDLVLPRLRALERDIATTIPGAIERLGARERAAERRLRGLLGRLSRVDKATVGLGAAGLVAIALSRIGIGFLRCTNIRSGGRRLCGMDAGAVEDILAGTLLIVGSISIVEFAEELQTIMGDAESGIRGFIRETR